MDKRTVLFIVLVSATFFGLNLYFSKQRDEKHRQLVKEKEAERAKHISSIRGDVLKRTAPLGSLPIVELNLGNKVVARGVSVDGNVMTLAWTKDLPTSVTVGGETLELQTADAVLDGPVVYAPQGFKDLDIASVPELGTYDFQLVTFPPDGSPSQVFYGEYTDGTLDVPLGPIDQNAIALYKTPTGYLPTGIYESQGDVFVEMQNLPVLSEIAKAAPVKAAPVTGVTDQKYYVLQNDYQQLVFTNVGGALSEINLPFETEENTKSVVKEIEFDREMVKDYPANARFPLHSYKTPTGEEKEGSLGGFYPLLRRGIYNGKNIAIDPQFYALNIVSDYPEMAKLVFDVKEYSTDRIVFEAMQPHRKITKTYTLSPEDAPYSFDVEIQIDGDRRGLWLTSGVPEVEIMSNRSSPQIQYRMTRKGKSEVEKLSLPKVKEVVSVSSVYPDWVVNSNGFLGMITDPLTEMAAGYRAQAIPGTLVPTRLSVLDPKHTPYKAEKYPGYETLMPLPTGASTTKLRIYSGPFEESVLKAVDKIYSDPATGYTPDYISTRAFYGWFSFISEPFAKLLFVVMKFFHMITGSWGFSIILLTVFLRLLLYPLNAWSIKSMRRMQKIAPEVKAIQTKYKKDPKRAQVEIMQLYRQRKVNPFMGCIPILIQLPFLIGMFDLLKSSFQLRGASFIPGWIDNLTAPDVLFSWSTPIFFIGNSFHLLPLLLGVVMFAQQRISSPTPKDPSKMTDQQRQQRTMGTVMAVVFTVMFYHFPSGLNLYWLSSMLLSILQQWATNKYLDKHKEKDIELPVKKLAKKKS